MIFIYILIYIYCIVLTYDIFNITYIKSLQKKYL